MPTATFNKDAGPLHPPLVPQLPVVLVRVIPASSPLGPSLRCPSVRLPIRPKADRQGESCRSSSGSSPDPVLCGGPATRRESNRTVRCIYGSAPVRGCRCVLKGEEESVQGRGSDIAYQPSLPSSSPPQAPPNEPGLIRG